MSHCLVTVESDKHKLKEKLEEASRLAMRLAASDYIPRHDQDKFKGMMTSLDNFTKRIF
jgi:hypothetical protein